MEEKRVRDLMLPLKEYALVSEDATLLEALYALDRAQTRLPAGKQLHRAVLVVNEREEVVGKLGHLGFLKALEPKYDQMGNLPALSQVGLSQEFLQSMMNDFRLWQDSLKNICRRAGSVKIKDAMRPVTENIDENASMTEAIHRIVMLQTLSLLVTRESKVVGILRLSDLFDELACEIKTGTD